MSQEWYYSVDGDRQGPISAADLKKLADAGTIKPVDLVWKDGMADWVAAKSIKGLFGGGAATPTGSPGAKTGEQPAAPQKEEAENRPSSRGRPRQDDEDDRPRRRRDEEEDDDRPSKSRKRDEEDDDRPSKSRRRDEEEEDRPVRRRRDEEDDRPRKKKGGGLPEDISSKKMVAGLLAILLNCLGIHKFYLGMTGAGLTMLLVTLTCIGWPVMQIIGIIEGIMYLTKSDEDFYQTYIVEKKAWF